MSGKPVNELLDQLHRTAARDFADARTAPPAVYHNQALLDLEIEQIFKREWMCVGRTAEVPNPGDYLTYEIIDQPVFVIRQKDDSLKAYANVCIHRGSKLLSGKGCAGRIVCPYHSWTYALDGQLIAAPYMDQNVSFDKKDHHLPAVRLEVWEGFIYVTLNNEAIPVAERLADLHPTIAQFHAADYVPVMAEEEVWDTNWKCLFENFTDAYHIHRVHKESFALNGSAEDRTTLHPGNDYFTWHCVDRDPDRPYATAHPDNTWVQEEFRSRVCIFGVFPNNTIQLQPDMLWYLSFIPEGTGKLRVRWRVSIPAEILDAAPDRQKHIDDVRALLAKVNSEDRPTVENLHLATASELAQQGPMSHLERNVYEFGRYLSRMLTGS